MGIVTNINIECCANKPLISLNNDDINKIKDTIKNTLKSKTNLLQNNNFLNNCSFFNKNYYDNWSDNINYDEINNDDYYNLKQKYYINKDNEIRYQFASLGPIFDNKLYDKYNEVLNYFRKYKIKDNVFYDNQNKDEFILNINDFQTALLEIKENDNKIFNYLTYDINKFKLNSNNIKINNDLNINFILHFLEC